MQGRENDVKVFEEKLWKVAQSPHFFVYILNDLERQVKRDIPSKCTTLVTCMSAYLRDPLNCRFKGVSGVGKTHNVTKGAEYFPKKDIMFLGGLSPKALIHQQGELLDDNDRPILLEDKPIKPMRRSFPSGEEGARQYDEALTDHRVQLNAWNERLGNSYRRIRLSHRTIVFLESPSEETIRVLYPILSHDKYEIDYRWVEEMQTRRAIIEGWPAAIFLYAQTKYVEEASTRSLTVTPESSRSKIADANILTNIKSSFPWKYGEEKESAKIIKEVISLIKDKLVSKRFDVVVPFDKLYESFPKDIVRDMRDFKHFMQFLKALTSFHLFQRPILKRSDKFYMLSSVDDVVMAMCIFSHIFETTRTGMDAKLLEFYWEIVVKRDFWYKRQLTVEYNQRHKKKVSSDTVGWWLRKLSDIGYVTVRKSEADKRMNLYEPLVTEKEKQEITRNLENREELRNKLEEDFENWLNNDIGKKEFFQYKISNGDMVVKEIDLDIVKDDIKKNSFRNIPAVFHSIYTELFVLKPEKQPEEIRETENRTFSDNSQSAEKCAICDQNMEGIIATVGDYVVHPECLQELVDQGYGDDDIIENIRRWQRTRDRCRTLIPKDPTENPNREVERRKIGQIIIPEVFFSKENDVERCIKCGEIVEEGARATSEDGSVMHIYCTNRTYLPYFKHFSELPETYRLKNPRCSVCTREMKEDYGVIGAYREWSDLQGIEIDFGGYILCSDCYRELTKKGCSELDIIRGIARLIRDRIARFGMPICEECKHSLYYSGNAREGVMKEDFFGGIAEKRWIGFAHVFCVRADPEAWKRGFIED